MTTVSTERSGERFDGAHGINGPAAAQDAGHGTQVVDEAAEWLVETILNHVGMQAGQAEAQTRRIGDGKLNF